ncbi:MAG: FKBP-type peptidyl-prolyl cis-trans isomerase [Methylophilaceae bacterium]
MNRLLVLLMLTFAYPTYAEEIVVPADATAPDAAAAGEEAPVAVDVPASKQELMQQAADGDVAQPRVRKFMKPNRSQLHASVYNQKSGYGFLDENQRKPGVVKLKSGLQYRVIKAGVGVKPTDTDFIQAQYRGTLVDGTVFEQSSAGKSSTIKMSALIPGLKEALKLMPAGSKWQVYIPAELGFGAAGNPPKVGPDAVLIYDLELLGTTLAASDKR